MPLIRGIIFGLLFEATAAAAILTVAAGAMTLRPHVDPSAPARYTQQVLQRE